MGRLAECLISLRVLVWFVMLTSTQLILSVSTIIHAYSCGIKYTCTINVYSMSTACTV